MPFNIGPGEIAIVFGLALLIFGPKKLPELGRAIGQGLVNFKRSMKETQHEIKTAIETNMDDDESTEKKPSTSQS
ncbi:MAG: twin-arginine translocase TatA/TatE family subunit [Candidatus Obscuribacterales bacterium]